MFKCISCGFTGDTFSAEVSHIDHGSYSYRAKCPKCGGTLVNAYGPAKEQDLRISIKREAKPLRR